MQAATYEPTQPAPRCEEHHGAHSLYQGRCYAFGRQVPRPLLVSRHAAPCGLCGLPVYGVIVRATMRRYRVEEQTGEEHWCAPAVRVEVDQRALTEGIAGALDALMARRREERAAASATGPTTASASRSAPRPNDRPPLGGVPLVSTDG